MDQTADQQNRDLARGIQNTSVRFKAGREQETLEAQLQQGSNKEGEENEEEMRPQTQRRALSQLQATTSRVAYRSKRPIQKGGGGVAGKSLTKMGPKRGMGRWLITGLVYASLFQIIFGVGSAVGFGLEAARFAACDTSIVSLFCGIVGAIAGFIDSITGINIASILSFTVIGWVFWVFIFLITIGVTATSAVLFYAQKVPALTSSGAKILATVAFGLNLVPFLNVVPIIEIWAVVWIFYGLKKDVDDILTV